ncbi:MAG: M15 family metallopeptidase [Succinivibrio sp.]|nr:M15 family metallopeptidase [Succinivibrio sp.]
MEILSRPLKTLGIISLGLMIGCSASDSAPQAAEQISGATLLTAEQLKARGTEQAWFNAGPIPEWVWQRMQGKTYKPNDDIGRDDLSYLTVLYHDEAGGIRLGEMVCNRLIAAEVLDIFRQLYEAGYVIGRIQLPDDFDADDERQMSANNTSSFCYRPVAGTKKLSKHALGLAVDLNTLYNPYCKVRTDGTLYAQPATGASYCVRSKATTQRIDEQDLAYKLFTGHGFEWGGHWQSLKDYQHFEKP